MQYLLTAKEMQTVDAFTSETIGIPSIVLMERAALAVASAVEADYPLSHRVSHAGGTAEKSLQRLEREDITHAVPSQAAPDTAAPSTIQVAVLAGSGNNGADGVAAGRILHCHGYQVRVYLTGNTPRETSLCARQLAILEHCGGKAIPFDAGTFYAQHPQVIIDAITGIGLRADSGSHFPSQAIYATQSLRQMDGARVYAVDMPSGVLADTGQTIRPAMQADVTITFGFAKRGQYLYPGSTLCGALRVADIGIDTHSLKGLPDGPQMFTYDIEQVADLLPSRTPAGNKGTFGKVLVIAGSRNMCGAALLSSIACARSGAGMVKVFTQECNRQIIQIAAPELLLGTYDPAQMAEENNRNAVFDALSESLSWADTVVIGPGLGRSEAAQYLVSFTLAWFAQQATENGAPKRYKGMVIDADAIRIIGEIPALSEMVGRIGEKIPVVFTPHKAECAALLGISMKELSEDTAVKIKKYADAHHCGILCKDARSLAVSFKETRVYLNTSGNDGLSTAGSGDVLAGMTGAFLGQGMDGFDAICAASYLHGRTAQRLTQGTGNKLPAHNTRSLIASDLLAGLEV